MTHSARWAEAPMTREPFVYRYVTMSACLRACRQYVHISAHKQTIFQHGCLSSVSPLSRTHSLHSRTHRVLQISFCMSGQLVHQHKVHRAAISHFIQAIALQALPILLTVQLPSCADLACIDGNAHLAPWRRLGHQSRLELHSLISRSSSERANFGGVLT